MILGSEKSRRIFLFSAIIYLFVFITITFIKYKEDSYFEDTPIEQIYSSPWVALQADDEYISLYSHCMNRPNLQKTNIALYNELKFQESEYKIGCVYDVKEKMLFADRAALIAKSTATPLLASVPFFVIVFAFIWMIEAPKPRQ